VSDDKRMTYCIYEAPTPEAICKTAAAIEFRIDQISQVSVLDPYFYN
jgi:hypothetical protein